MNSQRGQSDSDVSIRPLQLLLSFRGSGPSVLGSRGSPCLSLHPNSGLELPTSTCERDLQPSLSWVAFLGLKRGFLGWIGLLRWGGFLGWRGCACIINPTMALLAVPWHPQNQGGFSWTPFTQRRRGTGHRCFSLHRLPDPLVGGPGLPGCFGPALGDVFFFPRAGSLGLFQARCLTRGRENIWPLTQRLLTTSRSALLGCRG